MLLSRITIMLVGVAVLMLAVCCVDAAPPDVPPAEVGVVVRKAEPVTLTTELPGRVSAFETSEVRPQGNGIIRRRYFTEGSYVKQGALLYQIDDAPYRAALESARGQYARAEASIQATRLQSQRYTDLAKINAVSRQEADNAQAAAKQAQADENGRAARRERVCKYS